MLPKPNQSNHFNFQPPTPLTNLLPLPQHNIYRVNTSYNTIETDDDIIHEHIKKHQYSIFSTNIRSLTKHLTELKTIVSNVETDVIALQEIWNPHAGYVNIQNYHKIEMKKREKKRGGGVALYIKKDIKYELHKQLNEIKLEKIELIAATLKLKEGNVIVISIYRPPDSDMKLTIKDLDKILHATGEKKTVICGDLNIDTATTNNQETTYLNKLREYSMTQHITAYTRVTNKTKSTIDHTISNLKTICCLTTHHTLADHQAIITSWGVKTKTNTVETPKENDNKRVHYKKSAKEIQKVDWRNWTQINKKTDLNKLYDSFHNIIQNCIVHENSKSKKNEPKMPYITQAILAQGKTVKKARKKFLKKTTESNENEYKALKREYNKTLRKAKNEYYKNELKKAGKDSKKVWVCINKLIGRNSKKEPSASIIHENRVVTNNDEAANIFCEFFRSAAVNKITKSQKNYENKYDFNTFLDPKDKQSNTFTLKCISKENTWKIIKSLSPKKSSGFDEIPSKLINISAAVLATPLNLIINRAFESGQFPKTLKLAKICPIDKKKGEKTPENHRPLSQLSGFSKVIEKATNEQLGNHIRNNFDDRFQLAYKKAHSTSHAIILTRHTIEQKLTKKMYVALILLDLTLAFDTIETNEILPAKLKHYGAYPLATNLLKEFFTKRSQFVEWNNTKSRTMTLYDHSVVQGSCLGAPIFNLYTQELQKIDKNADTIMFADDTNLIISSDNINDLINKSNSVLETINQFMIANKLLVNESKSAYMLFKPKGKKEPENLGKITIKETEIKRVPNARYLGITIDEKMSFKEQFNNLNKKLKETVNALIAVRESLNYRAKIQLYHSFFESHLKYAAVTYFDKLNKTQVEILNKLQKKAIRLVFNAKMRCHTGKLLKLAEITPIDKIYKCETLKFVFKYRNELTKNEQPRALSEIFNQETKKRKTRQSNNKTNIQIKKGYKKDQAAYSLIKTWNDAENDLKNSGNLWSLKQQLKENIKNNITNCNAKKCYQCKIDKNINYENYMIK